jgi:hypothetical protein
MTLTPTPCSRCGSRWPQPGCVVCADEEHPKDCNCHECMTDRMAAYGDYLRDEMIDREMEERNKP